MNSPRKGKGKAVITVSVILGLVLASAIVIPRYVKAQNLGKTTQNSTQTRTVTVGTQDLQKKITGTGQILTGDQETLTLDKTLTVDEVLVKEGQAVKKGAALVTYTNGTELTAPFNGVIGTIAIADSSTTSAKTAASTTNTLTIMSTDTLVTQLAVDETDLQSLKTGQAAQVTLNALPTAPYTGKVTAIAETGTYSNGNSTFNVTITLDKTANVKIGMSADVSIVVASAKNAVVVPIEAVKGTGDNAKVSVVQSDGTVSQVAVKLGLANDAYVQVTSGLKAGDTIQYTVQTSNGTTGTGGMNFGLQGMSGNRSFPEGSMRGNSNRSAGNTGSANQSGAKSAQ